MNSLVLTWIPIGLLIGALGWIASPNRGSTHLWLGLSLGLVGAFLGSILSWFVFREPEAPFRLGTVFLEIAGALIALLSGVTVMHFRRIE